MTNCGNYFYKGKNVVVTHKLNGIKSIVRVVEDFTDPTYQHADFTVANHELKPLCFNVFDLGEHVYNVNGSFQGSVVAYELSTNRLVCVSDLISRYGDDRTRYAYKVDELRKVSDKLIEIRPGKYYNINNGAVVVWAVQLDKEEELLTLIDKNGIVFAEDIPFTLTGADAAMNFGIQSIVMKKRNSF